MPPIKILYIPSLNIGVTYWRIENYANELVRLKIPVFVEYFFDPKTHISWDSASIGHKEESERILSRLEEAFKYFDVIIFQKIQSTNGLGVVSYFKKKYPHVLVGAEIDDSIGDITPSNLHKIKDEFNCAAEHVALSDFVITSTTYLSKSILELNQNSIVMPNCIDENTFGAPTPIIPIPNRFAYVAGAAHDEDLELVMDVFNAIKWRYPQTELCIRYGGFKPRFMDDPMFAWVDFQQVNWSIEEYPNRLKELAPEYAIAPLRDSEFNRCKSNLKFVEWAHFGVPVIASNVEPYKKTLAPIQLCDNTFESWFNKLEKIITKDINVIRGWRLIRSSKEYYSLKRNTEHLVSELSKKVYTHKSSHPSNLSDDLREANGKYFINTSGPFGKPA